MIKQLAVASLACMALLCGAAHGQGAADYPNRPVSIVAPSQPGGGFDLMGRAMAEGLGRQFPGKSFVVENRTGSGTLLGTQFVAQSAPDGHTLLVGGLSNLVFNAALYKSPQYDPRHDFTTIGLVATYPYVLIARAGLPANSYAELLALIKAKPDELSIATGGPGSGQHILAAAFIKATGGKLTLIPYRGAQAAYQDLLGGRIDLFIDVLPTIRPHLDSKRVKALAVTSSKRLAALPEVPTVKELGLPALEAGSWFGLVAPGKTPAPIVERLRKALATAMAEPELKSRLEKSGVDVLSLSVPAADAFIKSEYDKWTGFIRQAGITIE